MADPLKRERPEEEGSLEVKEKKARKQSFSNSEKMCAPVLQNTPCCDEAAKEGLDVSKKEEARVAREAMPEPSAVQVASAPAAAQAMSAQTGPEAGPQATQKTTPTVASSAKD